MVFSSPIFLFLFLPLVLAVYFASPKVFKNPILLIASLLFYAWGELFYVLVMLASIATNYLCGVAVDRHRDRAASRLYLGLGVAANLLLLGSFKYANFIVDNLNTACGWLHISPVALAPVHLPIGISFFTFQAISYIVDVYRNEAPARHNPLHVALYIAMFPQLIAGPIVRYQSVARELVERVVKLDDFVSGVERFIIGLGKKMLLANPLGAAADQIFSLPLAELNPAVAWLGIVCYTLQIYFDFSGYSDMAIGLGRMFGFHFPENFNYPYISRSIREFWRRWHISLSAWMRDYLYVPLGGNRKSAVRTHLNLVTVFFLCGLWHGASWNFIIWGLLHGVFLVAERGRFGAFMNRLWPPVQHAYVLLFVMLGWVFFRIEALPDALTYVAVLLGLGAADPALHPLGIHLTDEVLWCLLAGGVCALPVLPALSRMRSQMQAQGRIQGRPARVLDGLLSGAGTLGLCLLLLVSAGALAASTYNPFLYFRF